MTLLVRTAKWRLQEFERELALLEVAKLTGRPARWQDDAILVEGSFQPKEVRRLQRRLALASEIVPPSGDPIPTVQHQLECAQGTGTRKTTSYALHALHPYKGKLYPQLAKALMNACDVPDKGKLLDPFAGCGTTVLEATIVGMRGWGVDANPLAVLVAQTKLKVLARQADALRTALKPLRRLKKPRRPLPELPYLQRWLPAENLCYLERLLAGISSLTDSDARDLAKVCLSSVLRLCSYQEPSQLRILRRRPDAEIPELGALFHEALNGALNSIDATHRVTDVAWSRLSRSPAGVISGDSRQLAAGLRHHRRGSFDAVITSPPYANALPYIDTDRISLRAFDMLGNGGQRAAELRQIGNREVPMHVVRATNIEVDNEIREPKLPALVREVLIEARSAACESSAGFRKQRTPGLLFSYFRDMQSVIRQASTLLRPGAPAAFIVGDSTIGASGGESTSVPTGAILADLAEQAGLETVSSFDKRLTSFGAPSTVHQRNAMASEKIFIFRRSNAEIKSTPA